MISVVLLSGGLDSTTLLYDVISKHGTGDVFAVSFDYGQRHIRELECAKATCQKLDISHKIINLQCLGEVAPSALTRQDQEVPLGHYEDENMKQTVVPNRNMVLLSLAGAYAIGIKAKNLFYGAHAGDHEIYPDCRKEFVEAMQNSFNLCDWSPLNLEAPYIGIDKGDILKIGLGLKVDYNLTRTCYQSTELACGKCGSCNERLAAFKKNEIKDPVKYQKIFSPEKTTHYDYAKDFEDRGQ